MIRRLRAVGSALAACLAVITYHLSSEMAPARDFSLSLGIATIVAGWFD